MTRVYNKVSLYDLFMFVLKYIRLKTTWNILCFVFLCVCIFILKVPMSFTTNKSTSCLPTWGQVVQSTGTSFLITRFLNSVLQTIALPLRLLRITYISYI